MNKIPNTAVSALTATKLSNFSMALLFLLLNEADESGESIHVRMSWLRGDLSLGHDHTYSRRIRDALAELAETFVESAEIADSNGDREGREIIFTIRLNPIFFQFVEKGDFTELPKKVQIAELARRKYACRAFLLSSRFKNGSFPQNWNQEKIKNWFWMPQKWCQSEVLASLMESQRLLLSFGLNLSLCFDGRNWSVRSQKCKPVRKTDENATQFRLRQAKEKRETRMKKFALSVRELAEFARNAAKKYENRIFDFNRLNLSVRIDESGLVHTVSGRLLGEKNTKMFLEVLKEKEERMAA